MNQFLMNHGFTYTLSGWTLILGDGRLAVKIDLVENGIAESYTVRAATSVPWTTQISHNEQFDNVESAASFAVELSDFYKGKLRFLGSLS